MRFEKVEEERFKMKKTSLINKRTSMKLEVHFYVRLLVSPKMATRVPKWFW